MNNFSSEAADLPMPLDVVVFLRPERREQSTDVR